MGSKSAESTPHRTSKQPTSSRFAIAILAAGKGTRLKSKHPKVLHEIGGRPLLAHVIAACAKLTAPSDTYVVIGHEAERVREAVQSASVNFVLQPEQRGTGDALMRVQQQLSNYEHVLVVYGDTPLVRPTTLERLRDFHLQQDADITILTAEPDDPTGYGRIIRGKRGEVEAIIEQKALKPGQLAIREINSGIYCFRVKPLLEHIHQLTTNNPAREYYLTDMAGILAKAGYKIAALKAEDATEVLGINSRAELAQLDAALRLQKCSELMAAGVTIFRPETCMIDLDVQVGADTVIYPFVHLLRGTRIGSDCKIGSFCVISNVQIGNSVEIHPSCVMADSSVASSAIVGPFARLRPGSEIGEGAHIGNFVETKKTRLGKGSKANHLTYLGDSQIGAGVNVGAGTITCNYDGLHKHPTVIEDGAFIGSDATLVAPVRVGARAYVGAASCITEDVPADALAIARGRQVNKPEWAKGRPRK